MNFIVVIFMGMKPSSGETNFYSFAIPASFFILPAHFCAWGPGISVPGPDLQLQDAAVKQRDLHLLKDCD